ncbi:MAG: prepilin-type N-terminal cleavage/methylation domain-containing protein [Pseudoalteromonas tetraodonis]|jgi:prepilin-type N-terminal cleavage/methylation domain-containing protein
MKTNLVQVSTQQAPLSVHRGRAAFTLVELLTVIAIIVILVGLTITILGFAQKKAAQSKAKGQMELIITGLTRYNVEFGGFPEPEDNSGQGSGGAQALYQALSGDGDDQLVVAASEAGGPSIGEVGSTTEPVVNGVDPNANKYGLVSKDLALVDPFGQYWHYRKYLGDRQVGDETNNKTYDLWSVGPEGEIDNEVKWIKNW